MAKSSFVYVTYIRTTPEKLWDALIKPEFTRKYWAGTHQVSAWVKDSPWAIMAPDGRVADTGKVVEIDPPRRLTLDWQNEFMPDVKAEGMSRCVYEIEPAEGGVKLTLTHEMDKPNSKLIEGVSGGWPSVLSNLKSLLETGAAMEGAEKWPEGV